MQFCRTGSGRNDWDYCSYDRHHDRYGRVRVRSCICQNWKGSVIKVLIWGQNCNDFLGILISPSNMSDKKANWILQISLGSLWGSLGGSTESPFRRTGRWFCLATSWIFRSASTAVQREGSLITGATTSMEIGTTARHGTFKVNFEYIQSFSGLPVFENNCLQGKL